MWILKRRYAISKNRGLKPTQTVINEVPAFFKKQYYGEWADSHKHQLEIDYRNAFDNPKEITFRCRSCFYSAMYSRCEVRLFVSGNSKKLIPIFVKK